MDEYRLNALSACRGIAGFTGSQQSSGLAMHHHHDFRCDPRELFPALRSLLIALLMTVLDTTRSR